MTLVPSTERDAFLKIKVKLYNYGEVYVSCEHSGYMTNKIDVPDEIIRKLEITQSSLFIAITNPETKEVLSSGYNFKD